MMVVGSGHRFSKLVVPRSVGVHFRGPWRCHPKRRKQQNQRLRRPGLMEGCRMCLALPKNNGDRHIGVYIYMYR